MKIARLFGWSFVLGLAVLAAAPDASKFYQGYASPAGKPEPALSHWAAAPAPKQVQPILSAAPPADGALRTMAPPPDATAGKAKLNHARGWGL